MKRALAVGLWLAFAQDAAAQGLGDAAAREKARRDAVRAAEWQEFRNPAGDFKVILPYAPLKKRELVPGMTSLMDTFGAGKEREKRFFAVSVGELEPEIAKRPADQTFEELRTGVLKVLEDAQLEDDRKITHGGRSGRAFRVRGKNKAGEPFQLELRSFLSGPRIFLVMSLAQADDKDTAMAERFFSSFAILR